MKPAYSVEAVRATEEQLLALQSEPDQLMQLAADAVARAATDLLGDPTRGPVVILAGPGGNGGDGLYAGAALLKEGYEVSAHVLGPAQPRALDAFLAAGGTMCAQPSPDTALVIDAVAGLGSARGLDGAALEIASRAPLVLAVDMPTGIDANTGQAADNAVRAHATVTFGAPRAGHVHAPECGEVVIADLALPGAPTFAAALARYEPAGYLNHIGGRAWFGAEKAGGPPFYDPTPGIDANKYSGGVVGIAAGSQQYPGAGILAATAAVRATPAMVRFIGDSAITNLVPELVVHASVKEAGRVQAWVVGPGRGTNAQAMAELEHIVNQGLPTVIDADAITLLAQRDIALHEQVIVTPHWGEFQRLYSALVGPPEGSRAEMSRELAARLGCHVLLKGRVSTVDGFYGINAGNSFAATPGSGDVLSGILGATLAMRGDPVASALQAVAIQAHAAEIAATTAEGYAPCSASQIAEAVQQATARMIRTN
ncbi:hypothetical protein CPHO_11945 [Corynebacterium phocae]|uniref:Bifunctional NAD(P)H-hydrate repair enzyme n=1 Tax=Corynebacterium phocae TaxID=161895 RepID=A0A1L7D665_9CORY|nr:bifunctional ADP-dependent NAD(P)H-hydrate dehydratase/NAD(P)H-hydrate epimerase [Corynebacterium phocae]APT93483.1 hypothetical protein CPHO_11945 [Corynebacterium phocae]KAA8720563.1 bifunctional ADP-dependent NAD(P)H-hydrate dehydratase/NAD(P)H-hydrate epimerase [Corynebacterium phocae]